MDMSQRSVVLAADDSAADRELLRIALREVPAINLYLVEDGEEVMDFLHRRRHYADPRTAPQPNLILLDLRMPRQDGHEVLQEIKSNLDLRRIPVVILTTSQSRLDIDRSYELGASSCITKPQTFGELIELMQTLKKYWFETVNLPV